MEALANNIVSICCVIAAAYIASLSLDGWGWFLFVSAITANWGYTKDGKRKFMSDA